MRGYCMNHWLYTANVKLYDVFAAMQQAEAYWPMNSKLMVGDQVFLYLSAPHKQIAYRCEVLETGVSTDVALAACKPFFKQAPAKSANKPFMCLQPQCRFTLSEQSPLQLQQLKTHGLRGMLMGPRKLENNPELLRYILGVSQ